MEVNEIEGRLTELRAELAEGERQLEALDRRRGQVRDTLLRITGAIQVLEELGARPSRQVVEAAADG